MNNISSNPYVGVPSRNDSVRRNSEEVAAGGAVGTATFATIRNSSKIGNSVIKTVKESSALKNSNKEKIIKILEGSKFINKFPFIKKIAGPLAGFSALATVTGSAVKIADTCNYLQQNKMDIDA